MTGLRTRKISLTRQTIALAAWTLFQQRPAGSVSVRDIAARAEVSERSVHNYFPTRADLVAAALEAGSPSVEYLATLAERPAEEHPATAFRRVMATAAESLTDKDARSVRSIVEAIRRDPELHAAQLRRTGELVELLAETSRERGAAHGVDDVDLAVLYAQCLAAIDVIAAHQPARPSVGTWVSQIDAALARIERGWLA